MNFIAKQALGGVTKDLQSLTEKKEVDPDEEKRRQEHQEALIEQENERKAKHAKFEAGRESARNKIRNKHGLKTAEEKAEQAKLDDPMSAGMSAGMPDSTAPQEYSDDMMGQAQYIFDEVKNKTTEMTTKFGEFREEAMSRAPDQCKQQ